MAFKVNLLIKVITISSWVENRRLRRAEAEYSFLELVLVDGGSDKPLLREKLFNFVTVNSIIKRYNLRRGEISEVTKSCNFKRFVGVARR